jgi:putative SOS response-associated peptidase YedK
MCGRFSFTPPLDDIAAAFDVDHVSPEAGSAYRPRWNIAPTDPIVVIVGGAKGRRLEMMRWGLVPGWEKGPKSGPLRINARAESVASRPSFRDAFKSRRCLVPADGFYEWQKRPDGRQPFHIRATDGQPLAFAGIWETWGQGAQTLTSVSIITTDANAAVEKLHDRMPVILAPSERELWLDPNAALADLAAALEPCPAERLVTYPVSRRVNTVGNDDPECAQPVSDASPPQLDLFSRRDPG